MLDEGITIDTSELDGLAQLLERFPQEVQSKMLKQSLGAGAAVLLIGVMAECPVRLDGPTEKSTGLKAGMLKADIRANAGKNGRSWFIGAGTATAYVLRWLERGHMIVKGGHAKNRRHGGGKGRSIGHVPAWPVLRPAFDAYWNDALKATSIELQNRIAEYWKQTLGKLKRAA
jgi:hypothetical protein